MNLWVDQLGEVPRRAPLRGDTTADVCVVGAGLTGLWTARWLLAAQPTLRVLVVDDAHVGLRASGRNGGWASALFPRSTKALARQHGRGAALAMRRAMVAAVGELGEVLREDGIECDYRRGETVVVARTRPAGPGSQEVDEAPRRRAWTAWSCSTPPS